MNEQEDGLITVQECARALGIDPTQVRRYAARLHPPDRTQDRQRPLRVRLEAVERLRHARNGQKDTGQTPVLLSYPQVIQVYERLLAEKDARIAALEANVADLRRLLPPGPEEAQASVETPPQRPGLWARWFGKRG